MNAPAAKASQSADLDFDVIIIGAGLSGLYQLHKLRELGLTGRVFETGTGVGGTWYWNRYPGARFDSESYSYGFSFSQKILDEWNWTEHFAPQPETERYANFVADKLDLRRDIQFSSRVTAAHFDSGARAWTVEVEGGERYRCRFLITAVGPLSTPVLPNIEGRDDFKGEAYHTGLWPKERVSFEGKRVAVIGTGATGVQTIQEVAKTAKQLTVFQRRPNWCAPLHNDKIDAEEMERIRESYPDIFRRCQETTFCFLHTPDPRSALEVSDAEREAFLEARYNNKGFGMWQGNFRDMGTDPRANKLVSDFVARKIRERVDDPDVAELLIPKCHGFGTRRVPLETKYYEVYNQPNVRLYDIMTNPIERITETGLETTDEAFEFDMIIYATGFDAVTGALYRIDFRGEDGVCLQDRWEDGIETFFGMLVDGFPNMFMLVGPHTALGNIPRSIEFAVEWVSDLLGHISRNDVTLAEAKTQSVVDWTNYVASCGENLLSRNVDSWMTGINQNIDGKDKRMLVLFRGAAPEFRERAKSVAAAGYPDIAFD